jgi:hypothetical protein
MKKRFIKMLSVSFIMIVLLLAINSINCYAYDPDPHKTGLKMHYSGIPVCVYQFLQNRLTASDSLKLIKFTVPRQALDGSIKVFIHFKAKNLSGVYIQSRGWVYIRNNHVIESYIH